MFFLSYTDQTEIGLKTYFLEIKRDSFYKNQEKQMAKEESDEEEKEEKERDRLPYCSFHLGQQIRLMERQV